jgi:DNA-binding NtrC family response regulator/tetratricopeptide (TPR) repeat protein
MTKPSQKSDEDEVVGWDPDALADEFCAEEHAGRLVHLIGAGGNAIGEHVGALRNAVTQRDTELLVLDPTGGIGDGSTFREVVSTYVRRVEQHVSLDEQTEGLAEFIATSRSLGGQSDGDAVDASLFESSACMLWERLSQVRPAVLLVVHPEQLSGTERSVLGRFIREYLHGPFEEFGGGLDAFDSVRGCVAVVGQVGRETPFGVSEEVADVIDLTDAARESVKAFLSREDVVDRFLASTEGNPTQLDVLMDELPTDCANLWEHRYRDLEAPEQRVVQLLAVAEQAVPVEILEGAIGRLDVSRSAGRTMRTLRDDGFVRRSIGDGCVTLQLEDAAFARSVREQLGEAEAQQIHRVLAEASTDGHHRDGLDDAFIAKHFLAAGDQEEGFEYGLRAARRMHSRHALHDARELFERILPMCPSNEKRREILSYLVDIYEGLGEYDSALEANEELIEGADPSEAARLTVKRGDLLVESDDFEGAVEVYRESASRGEPSTRTTLRARLGIADAHYKLGDQSAARTMAEDALEYLAEHVDDLDEHTAEKIDVRAKNMLGKVEIMSGDIDAARPIYERNLNVAREWGWELEELRAEVNLAVCDLQDKEYQKGISRLRDVIDQSAMPNGMPRAEPILNLGMALQRVDEYASAMKRYRDAMRAAQQSGDRWSYGVAAYNLGTLFRDMGALGAVESIARHLQSRQDIDEHTYLGSLPRVLMVMVHLARGDYEKMLQTTRAWTDTHEKTPSRGPANRAVARSIIAHAQIGQVDEAERMAANFDDREHCSDGEVLDGLVSVGRAQIAVAREQWDEAVNLGREAAQAMRDQSMPEDALHGALAQIRGLEESGRKEEAQSVAETWLADVQRRGSAVPDSYRDEFFEYPLHSELISTVHRLKGDIPAELDSYVDRITGTSDQDAEVRTSDDDWRTDAAFRQWRSQFDNIVGQDERLLRLFRRIEQVADSESPVLIQGESGTGKELVAEAIHEQADDDGEMPFVKVNCGAFVDNLLLSELFGHEKGAFTGAVEETTGRFERADGGIIFLDEIGEISQKAQVALLRVLQEGEFERVGGNETREVDVRVVCATNRDLETMVDEGTFRLDLYYRLKGVVLDLPPLRERRADIPLLVHHFADQFADGEAKDFSRKALEFLAAYSWPGNVRELQNFVRSVLLFVDGSTVEIEHIQEFSDFFSEGEVDMDLPDIEFHRPLEEFAIEKNTATADADEAAEVVEIGDPREALIEEIIDEGLSVSDIKEHIEFESIRRALTKTGGNITRAAEILQMTRPRLSQIVNGDDDLKALKQKLVS